MNPEARFESDQPQVDEPTVLKPLVSFKTDRPTV